MKKFKRIVNYIGESILIVLVVVGAFTLFPILFAAFLKYGIWVTELLGLQ